MTTLPIFTNGQQGSASQLMNALSILYTAGKTNLDNLTNIRTESLLAFQRRVSYLNSKQQKAKKLVNQSVLVNFSVSDFSNIDQSETTATVRIDTNVANSSEQAIEVEAVIKNITFNSTVGSVETLNSNSNIYRVYNTNNQTPTGTFFVTLRDPINLSVVVFDLPSIASNPVITVEVSDTNLLFVPCLSYSLNGYRLIVYLKPDEIQYIKLSITPSHPDNLGGSLFTFGITDFVGSSTQYRLLSEFVSRPLEFTPTSLNCQLSGIETDGVLYFLSLAGGNYVELALNTGISIPGVSSGGGIASLNSSGMLNVSITDATYISSLSVIDNNTGLRVPILYGLSITADLTNLTKSYITVLGNNLYYIPYINSDSSKTFTVSYLEGPTSLSAQIKVQISTDDKNSSPIFNGVLLIPA